MVTAPAKPVPTPVVDPEFSDPYWQGDPLVIAFPPGVLDDELFLAIARLNDCWHFERNCEGRLEVSPPPGSHSGRRGGRIFAQILEWSDNVGGGESFPAGSGFSLATGSTRDPDAAWFSTERIAQADPMFEGHLPICPNLVVEVRSYGQTVRKQREKMEEWLRAGARLGWLIDPFTDDGVAWVYRAGQNEPECLARPATLDGEDVTVGLSVDLGKVWRPLAVGE